jgi:hypothetical protein
VAVRELNANTAIGSIHNVVLPPPADFPHKGTHPVYLAHLELRKLFAWVVEYVAASLTDSYSILLFDKLAITLRRRHMMAMMPANFAGGSADCLSSADYLVSVAWL